MSEWSPDIDALRNRDNTEWLRVQDTYCGRLLAYANRRTGDLQASEDVVQETLLGAVRGIGDFDEVYTFEQYLFGICRNRTIDYLRRRKAQTIQVGEDDTGFPGMEALAHSTDTPSAIVRGRELSSRAKELLAEMLREWVEETWEQGEFVRLAVIESLFSGGWRNRDTWRRFQLRDETSVAGIKFRAIKRLKQFAAVRESGSDLLHYLAAAEEGDTRLLDIDVRDIWREKRLSCPGRSWLARYVAETLDEGPKGFLAFHLDEMKCPWCQANHDDLAHRDQDSELDVVLERVRESTLRYLDGDRATPTGG